MSGLFNVDFYSDMSIDNADSTDVDCFVLDCMDNGQEVQRYLTTEIERYPEKNMLFSILLRSIIDLSKEPEIHTPNNAYINKQAENAEEAREWFASNAYTMGLEGFSFLYICEELKLNHYKLRQILADKARLKKLAKELFYTKQKSYKHDQAKRYKWAGIVEKWVQKGKPHKRSYALQYGISLNGFHQAIKKYT